MSRVLVTIGPASVGNRVFLGLLAAGRAVRVMVGSSTQAGLVRAMAHADGLQPRAHLLLAAAERAYYLERLDGAAGCEFVDDRLRQRE